MKLMILSIALIMIAISRLCVLSNLKIRDDATPKIYSSQNKEIQMSEKQIQHNNSGTSICRDMSSPSLNKSQNDFLIINSIAKPKLEIKTRSKLNTESEIVQDFDEVDQYQIERLKDLENQNLLQEDDKTKTTNFKNQQNNGSSNINKFGFVQGSFGVTGRKIKWLKDLK